MGLYQLLWKPNWISHQLALAWLNPGCWGVTWRMNKWMEDLSSPPLYVSPPFSLWMYMHVCLTLKQINTILRRTAYWNLYLSYFIWEDNLFATYESQFKCLITSYICIYIYMNKLTLCLAENIFCGLIEDSKQSSHSK